MDRFARELDAWITREQDHGPECECGNSRERDEEYCVDCVAEFAADAAQAVLARTLLEVTARIAADARRTVKHVELALDFDAADEPLFVGALTEADLERFAAAEAPAYAVAS